MLWGSFRLCMVCMRNSRPGPGSRCQFSSHPYWNRKHWEVYLLWASVGLGPLICKMLNNHIVTSQVYLEDNPVFLKCFGCPPKKQNFKYKALLYHYHYYYYYYNLFEQPFPCQNSGIITLQWRSDYSGKEMALGKDCHTQLLWSVVGSIGL